MAKETKEERRARIEKEVAERSAARRETYFEKQAESKAAAQAIATPLPKPDAFNYTYAWKQDAGAPTGEITLVKTQNPYYDASTNTIVDPATGERTPATQSMWSGPTTFRGDGTQKPFVPTGSSDQLYANKYAAGYGIDNAGNQYRGTGTTADPFTMNGQPFTGSWSGKTYQNGMLVSGTRVGGTGDGFTGTGSTGTGSTGFTGTAATGPTLARDVFKNTLATFFGQAELTKPWMDALYDVVSKFYKGGSDIETSINLSLQDARNNPALKPFTDRFKGIYALQDLRQQGKPITVPTVREYVSSQATMADTFREAGLGDLATEEFTGDLIGKGLSVSTVADRIAKAFYRIDQAPKIIKDTLSRYFPTVDRTTLARTLLTGAKGTEELVDELAQYEVLAAAEAQRVGIPLERAREYARAGGTFGGLLPKFGQVRAVTPEVSKLAGISRRADIGQEGVEQAIISGLAQPMEEIQQLGEEELSRFSGRAGIAQGGLASQRRASRTSRAF